MFVDLSVFVESLCQKRNAISKEGSFSLKPTIFVLLLLPLVFQLGSG
jgi:hypothetical protein